MSPEGQPGDESQRSGPPEREPRQTSPASRLLRPAARGASRLAGVTGIDKAIEEAAEEAIVRALRSPAVERAIERVIEENTIEDAVQRALTSDEVAEAIVRALDTDVADRVWAELLSSQKAQMLVERIAEAPEVRAAIAQQGFGLLTDIGRRLTKITEALDDVAERVVHGLFGREGHDDETNQVGLVTRLAAGAIDVAGMLALFSISSGLIASIFPVATGDSQGLSVLAIAAIAFAAFLVGGGIFVTFWALVGQTPGMRFLSIRLDAEGSPEIGLRRAVRRLVAIPFSLGFGGLGFISILLDPRRRGWHDKFAGTEVVYDTRSSVAPWATSERQSGRSDGSSGDRSARAAKSVGSDPKTDPTNR